jgi:hypothetical protein
VILGAPPAQYTVQDQSQVRRSLEQTVNDLLRRVQVLEATSQRVVNVVIDGGGVAITTGTKGEAITPKARITGWTVVADQTGSIVVDIQRSTGGGAYSTITGSEKPTLSSAVTASDTTLTSWSPDVLAGDKLRFIVDSVATVQRVTVSLYLTPLA